MKKSGITITNDEKIALISSMSTMLSAGIPIIEIVDSLLEDAKGNQKKILDTLKADLIQGNRVYHAFSQYPSVFDKVSINIIRASEEAGTLEITLKEVKNNIQKEIEFVDKIKSALAYPVLIIGVFLGVMLMILTFVIPKISVVFSRMKVTLPLPTRIMIFVSDLLMKQTIPLLLSTIFLIFITIYLYRTNKKMLLNAVFSIPYIDGLAKQIDLTRFTRVLYMLLNAGIPITLALDLCREVVFKKDIARMVDHLKEEVLTGKRLSEGMKDSKKLIPSLMIKITEAGEKSGSLEKSMKDISEYLDYQVSKSLKSATTLLEPVMMIFVGLLIGGMMLAIIAPIYGLMSQVGGR